MNLQYWHVIEELYFQVGDPFMPGLHASEAALGRMVMWIHTFELKN